MTYNASMLMEDVDGKTAFSILHQAFEKLAVSIIIVDPLSRLFYANKAALLLVGYTKEELLHVDLQQIAPFLTPEVLTKTLAWEANSNGQPPAVNAVFRKKGGREAEGESYLRSIEAAGNHYVLVSVTEIKEQQEIQSALVGPGEKETTEDKEELHTIFERITDGFTAFDKDWNYTHVNKKAAEVANKKPADMIGRNVWEMFPEVVGSSLYKNYYKAMKEQVVIRTEEYIELFQKWFEGVLYPSPEGLSVFFQDITEKKKAEASLEEKELMYRTIVETSQEGIWQIDAENRTSFVNQCLLSILGYTREEMIGRSFLDFMTEEARSEALDLVEERKKGVARQHEFTLLHKNGNLVFTLLKSSPLLKEGKYAGAVATVLDNTQRKKAEEKLLENERRFRALFEYNQDGIALLADDGVIMDVSPSIQKILGLPKEELVGTGRLDYIDPEDVHIVIQTFEEVLKEPLKSKTAEYRAILQNGTRIWLECTYSNLLNEPAVKAMVLNFRDITERKNAETKLKESEARYRKAQAQGKLGHWEWDILTNNLIWSDEIYTMFGLDQKTHEPNYDKFLSCIHPDERAVVETNIRQAVANGQGYEITYRIVTEDDSVRHVYTLAELVNNESGQLIKVVGMVQDITEQKRIEQELSLSERNYRLLFEKSPVPFLMVDYPSFDLLEVNQAAMDLYGYSREEFLSMNVRDIRFENDEDYFADLNKRRVNDVRQSIARHRKRNGEFIIVHLTNSRITYNGKMVWLASMRDITQELLYEKQLEEKQQQLSVIFNSSINGMALFEVEHEGLFRFAAINDALCNGIRIRREEVLGKLLSDVFASDDIQHLLPGFRKAVTTGTVQSFTALSTQRVGNRIIEYTAIPIRNRSGNVVQLLSVSNDITEKKKAEEDLLNKNIELRQLTSHLENVREEERTKMAREIHDELGQQLTGLKMEVSWISRNLLGQNEKITAKLKSSLSLIDETINSVRRISTQLRPSILDDLGLAEAIEWQGSEFRRHTGIPFHFSSNVNEFKFSPPLSIAVFRVLQEALTNVARHAKATRVNCSLQVEDNILTLTVADNGTGFSVFAEAKRKTLGLLGMNERVTLLQGSFTVDSYPGQGTTITVKVPLG